MAYLSIQYSNRNGMILEFNRTTSNDFRCGASGWTSTLRDSVLRANWAASSRPQNEWAETIRHLSTVPACNHSDGKTMAYAVNARPRNTTVTPKIATAITIPSAHSKKALGQLSWRSSCISPGINALNDRHYLTHFAFVLVVLQQGLGFCVSRLQRPKVIVSVPSSTSRPMNLSTALIPIGQGY